MSEVPIQLLREALRDSAAPSSETACLDAETLAAWADGTLPAANRAALETHAAGCARCQAMLAAMVRTAPPQASRAPWRIPALGWLVPLTAAAAALAIWVNVSSRATPPSAPRLVDASRAEQRSPAAGPVVATPPTAATPPTSRAAEATPVDKLAAGTERRDRKKLSVAAAAAANAAPATPAAATTVASATETPTLAGARPSPPPAPATPPEPVGPASAPPAAPATADVLSGYATRASTLALKAAAAPAAAVIQSSDLNVRWRIVPGGAVERSTDGGTTWQRQATGVTVTLAAGAAPSPTICWLVGPAGVVLLSIDGQSWRRIAFPEAIDLASVHASDDKTATVTAVDGRSFSTTDGGRTWTR